MPIMWFDDEPFEVYKDLTNEVTRIHSQPFATGRSSDFFRARWRTHANKRIALKISRITSYENIVLGQRLTHENIVSFLGICSNISPSVTLVLPYFYDSPVSVYLRRQPRRNRLALAYGVANGLTFLHQKAIVHGNLTADKVLIDKHGIPRIYGFDVSQIFRSEREVDLSAGPFRFMAPELLRGLFPGSVSDEDTSVYPTHPTTATDVYAFSMVFLEILTSKPPFASLYHERPVVREVLNGKRPQRDEGVALANDEAWSLLETCWAQNPDSRPGMDQVSTQLQKFSPSSPSTLALRSGFVRIFARFESIVRKFRVSTSNPRAFDTLPLPTEEEQTPEKDLTGQILRTEDIPFGTKFSLIYKGRFKSGDRARVIIKILISPNEGPRAQEIIRRRLYRETRVWAPLMHENVLPFLGICRDIAPTCPALISPYCENGHLNNYLERYPEANRQEIVIGFSRGLGYLHFCGVAHGDLKPQNIVVNQQGVPRICDFGISKIIDHQGFTTGFTGTPEYMAPEQFEVNIIVLDADQDQDSDSDPPSALVTPHADIYSFGLVVIEIISGKPRPALRNGSGLLMTPKQCAGRVPRREYYPTEIVHDELWSLFSDCWKMEPKLRANMDELVPRLSRVLVPSTS